jgi:hypothetical protein
MGPRAALDAVENRKTSLAPAAERTRAAHPVDRRCAV